MAACILIVFYIVIPSHFYVESMFRIRHLTRSCASSADNSLSDKSFLMLSNHLCFGLPLLLFLGTSITITLLPTYFSSLLNTISYQFNRLSCTVLDIPPTFVIHLILSFIIIILSSLVTSTHYIVCPRCNTPRYNADLLITQSIMAYEMLAIGVKLLLPELISDRFDSNLFHGMIK